MMGSEEVHHEGGIAQNYVKPQRKQEQAPTSEKVTSAASGAKMPGDKERLPKGPTEGSKPSERQFLAEPGKRTRKVWETDLLSQPAVIHGIENAFR